MRTGILTALLIAGCGIQQVAKQSPPIVEEPEPCLRAGERTPAFNCADRYGVDAVCAYDPMGYRGEHGDMFCAITTPTSHCAQPTMELAETVGAVPAGACVCVDGGCELAR